MRATLTYSVPFFEVPREAARMAEEAAKRLDITRRESAWVSAALLVEEAESSVIKLALDKLDEVRILLADIDHRLADCHGVLSGYLRVHNAENGNAGLGVDAGTVDGSGDAG